jgi:hypothetical protein
MSVVPEVPKLDAFLSAATDLLHHPTQDVMWELKKLRGYRDALFEHFAPFKVDDRIRLHTDVDISRPSGWAGYEAMMTAGATAKVAKGDWIEHHKTGKGGWVIHVVFDEEFRDGVSTTTRSVPRYYYNRDEKHTFCFADPERHWTKLSITEA